MLSSCDFISVTGVGVLSPPALRHAHPTQLQPRGYKGKQRRAEMGRKKVVDPQLHNPGQQTHSLALGKPRRLPWLSKRGL